MRRLFSLLLVSALWLTGCGSDGGGGSTVEAVFDVAPSQGTAITDFLFDASGSSTSGRALEARWDWDGDGTWDTDWSTELTVTHRFADGGTLSVFVEVTDGSDTGTAFETVIVDGRHGHVEELFAMPRGGIPSDIAYDGSYIWVTNWEDATWKVDAVTGDSLGWIPGNSAWTGGVTWDGTYVCTTGWVGGSKIFMQDPSDGSIESSLPVVYCAHSSGLDWDPEAGVFYYGSSVGGGGGDGHIHVYTASGTEVSSFPSPRGSDDPRGVAFDGENAWVVIADVDSLYVVDPDDGDVLRVLAVPDRSGGIDIMNDRILVMLAGYPRMFATVVP